MAYRETNGHVTEIQDGGLLAEVCTLRLLYLVKPNTHRRRRRDETVESRRVGVGGVYWALL